MRSSTQQVGRLRDFLQNSGSDSSWLGSNALITFECLILCSAEESAKIKCRRRCGSRFRFWVRPSGLKTQNSRSKAPQIDGSATAPRVTQTPQPKSVRNRAGQRGLAPPDCHLNPQESPRRESEQVLQRSEDHRTDVLVSGTDEEQREAKEGMRESSTQERRKEVQDEDQGGERS
ncbi:hypothetical protein FQA47_024321 [Oryzias melastigma]|uniref:Uncharacterized protein n=1 Tax=Oryzias melastigma TaxID=30732 RepID=A0A834EYD1_ORYME|nr:hypothetical protein FQA47_024321 [Oryzias melastigma]